MLRKLFAAMLAAVMALAVVPALAQEAPQYDYKLTISLDNFMPEVPPADSASMKFLEEKTQTDIDCNWIPSNDYMTKINAMIAANTLTDVVVVTDIKNANIINAARAGVFWELTDYIQKGDFPRLKSMNEVVVNNIKIDGKLFALPRNLELPFHAITYRSDWLENLGLKKPTTLDELYEVIRAFTQDDPDGNGADDTYGLVMNSSNNLSTEQIQLIMGGPNNWEITADGKFVPFFKHESYMPTLNWLKRIYDEGLANPDFASITEQQQKEMIEASKVGVSIQHIAQITERVPVLRGINPNYDMDYAVIDDGHGVRLYPSAGVSGIYMIPKSSVPTEEELMRVLAFFERLAAKEVQTFMQWGLTGVHSDYNKDGKLEMIDPSGYNAEVNVLRRLKPFTLVDAESGVAAPEMEKRNYYYATMEQYCIGDPSMAFISETNMKRGSELYQMIDDASIQYIMGAITEQDLLAIHQQWFDEGGEQIIAEYEAAYAQSKK